MAEKISEKEDQLRKRARRRLVGAIALVVISVVVLPLVFDGKPQQKDHEIEVVVSPGNIPGKAADKPLPEVRGTGEGEVVDPAGSGLDGGTPFSSVRPAGRAEEEATRESAAGPVESKSVAASKIVGTGAEAGNAEAESFVVQLGAFTDPEKARQQHKHPALDGFRIYTEQSRTETGEIVTRVRVGPFANRADAELVREKLKTANISGVVTNK